MSSKQRHLRTECVSSLLTRMEAVGWVEGSESAKEMLSRLLRDRPFFLLPPPLHRLPFRVGNVVELVGPSPSAKTHILMDAAIACILPKHCGGQGHPVVFLDLDCRFDISRLSHLLKLRLSRFETGNADVGFDAELFTECMRRFLYVRCYHSLQFLATLKTLHYQLQKVRESHGISAHLLMVDRFALESFVRADDQSSKNNEGTSNAVQEMDEEFTPVDVDVNLVKSLLDSFSSQQGQPGPASNLLGHMGLQIPQDPNKGK